jgi:hypothetical protein
VKGLRIYSCETSDLPGCRLIGECHGRYSASCAQRKPGMPEGQEAPIFANFHARFPKNFHSRFSILSYISMLRPVVFPCV